MKLSSGRRQHERDDLIPLINVIFLLLIFFMIAGTLSHRPSVEVSFVETAVSPATQPPQDTLIVTADGTAYYEGSPVAPEDLESVLATDGTLDREAPFPVVVDRAVTMSALKPISDGLKRSGLARLRIITLNGRS